MAQGNEVGEGVRGPSYIAQSAKTDELKAINGTHKQLIIFQTALGAATASLREGGSVRHFSVHDV